MHVIIIKWWMIKPFKTIPICAISLETNEMYIASPPVSKGAFMYMYYHIALRCLDNRQHLGRFWKSASQLNQISISCALVKQFPHTGICRQTSNQPELKFGGWPHHGTLHALLTFKSRSAEFPPFTGLWLVELFPCICRQTADQIELKVYGWTYYGTDKAWLTFGHAPQNFHSFLSDWLVDQFMQFMCICTQTTKLIKLKFGGWTHHATPQAWSTFSETLLNSRHSMASDWSSNFSAFADKALFGLSSNLVDHSLWDSQTLNKF